VTRQRTRGGHTHKAVRRVRWIRRHRGWTHAQLAQRAGLREETVRLVELGHRAATPHIVHRIAVGLGVDPELLYPGGRAIFLHRFGVEMRRRFPAHPITEETLTMTDKPIHGVPDYDSRVAKLCEESGEPRFLLRAQDIYASAAVRSWADLLEQDGGSAELVAEARSIADAMDAWPTHKVPD
jgi:transcriptional regulator with XRE-family HTH domain